MDDRMTAETVIPLREATFLILLSLEPGPKHGYAIMKDVVALSDGRVQLSTGTLYGALKRLLAQAWIERVEPDGAPVPGAGRPGLPRRTYVLASRGRRMLDAELARLRSLLYAADVRTAKAQP